MNIKIILTYAHWIGNSVGFTTGVDFVVVNVDGAKLHL
jgi:hypothetical protein